MILSDISIRRPVLATVMSLLIILLGVISFDRLSVREYPKIDPPVVSVRTVYKGATAQVVESVITTPIEDALSGIEGIKTIKSQSREEVSQITVTFVTDRDVEAAANDVRDRVSRVRALLPDQADDPVVNKIEADAWPVMWIAVTSDRHSPMELTDYADRYLTDPLKTIPGVATVIIGGERKYAMRVWLDRERLAALGLAVQDVEQALRRQNLDSPGGRIESTQRELTVLAETDLKSAEAFNNMIIRDVAGYPIRLKDVGYAAPGPYENRKIVRISGNEAIGLGVVKQSTGNTLAIAEAVREMVPRLKAGLPPGMSMKVAVDTSQFIEAAINAVYKVLLEALTLVVLVIFLFLRSVRATLIPAVTIPVSLIGAFFFLYMFGFSVNVLTLLGIVLAVGLVVDDAIVMLENIHRHIEEGLPPYKAAMKGAKEIGFAVVAMTVTLAAVFTPLVFMTGRVGQLFVEFALTVVAAVVVSGFVALTLTPMMCSKVLKAHESNWLYDRTEGFFEGMNRGYQALLRGTLRARWAVALVFGLVLVAMVWLFTQLKSELSPVEDRGVFMAFAIAPEGSTMQYTDRYMRAVGEIVNAVPEVDTLFEVVAPGLERPNPVNVGIGFAVLKHWDQRDRSQMEISKELTPKLFGALPGVLSFTVNPPSLGQNFLSKQIEYVIYGTSYEELQGYVNKVMARLREYPGITGLDTDLKLNKPQLRVEIDRDKAAAVGVSMETIGSTLETLLGGRDVTRYKREGKQYDVVVQMEDDKRRRPDDLTSIYVRSANGDLVQLSNLVQLRETVAPKELNHFNKFRAAVINGNVGPGASLGDALAYIDKVVAEELPQHVLTDLDGQSREFRETGVELYVTLALALIFIYLVLSAQFESFVGPFVIMLTVPLAGTGALLAMWINAKLGNGGTLNVYSQIGLVMLVGLITKNGILIVEFANQLRRRGMELFEAVVEASTLRLRPILMTTFATVLGAVPLAISTGAGAEARQAIGWVIVGGMLLGTFLTLFVIPAFYTLIVRGIHLLPEEKEALLAPGGAGPLASPQRREP
ncbi:MAG TPA: efflux RND transporter permease subunit [Burkholderiales bacterium]|jgi:multidrug efflux pump|nr:efflux RND transporter permease subunit [Burkholderiales bacterium]